MKRFFVTCVALAVLNLSYTPAALLAFPILYSAVACASRFQSDRIIVLNKLKQLLDKLSGKAVPGQNSVTEPEEEQCCQGIVHIAYRGVSDERLYMAYSRKWPEVRFFKPNGLKVFCADCRRRLL